MKKQNNKNNLLRFLAGLAVLAVLALLTAGSCDKKGGKTEKPEDKPKVTPCTDGFEIKLAKDSFAGAFEIGKFKQDGTTKAYNADVTLKLSALTNANGFVSNHIWIHDEKINPVSFKDMGTAIASTIKANAGVAPTFTPATTANTAAGEHHDMKYCSSADATSWYGDGGVTRTTDLPIVTGGEHIAFKPVAINGEKLGVKMGAFLTPTTWLPADTTSLTSTDTAHKCKDLKYEFGAILQPGAKKTPGGGVPDYAEKGRLLVGFTGPLNGAAPAGTVGVKQNAHDPEFEPNMDKTGAYYTRANFAYEQKETARPITEFEKDAVGTAHAIDGAMNKVIVTKNPVGYANDTDDLYNEVKTTFVAAGEEMADLADVFKTDSNMGIETIFTHQPVGKAADRVTGFAQITTSEALGAKAAGSVASGGWQKLFTIKSCNDKMKNGFAVAYKIATAGDLTTWAGTPKMSYDSTTTNIALPEAFTGVALRRGTKAANGTDLGNAHAMLFESVLENNYNIDNSLGTFTFRHDSATGAMVHAKNAMATKGVLFCRSALAMKVTDAATATAAATKVTDLLAAGKSVADMVGYTETLVGYVDAEVKKENEGLGMTCYLGLTALWPTAYDDAPLLTKDTTGIHTVQTGNAAKTLTNVYDHSDKYIGVVMVNIAKDATLHDPGLKPFFIDRFKTDGVVATAKVLDETKGAAALKATVDTPGKVSYIHGGVTLKFKK